MLAKIHFFLEQSYSWARHYYESAEAEVAVRAFRREGLQGEVTVLRAEEAPFGGAAKAEAHRDTLFLADSRRLVLALRAQGLYVAAYSHGSNAGEDFSGVSYVVEEPQLVDKDSYIKIYERLAGLPWTILTTDRCVVREFTEADVDALYDCYDDAQARRFLDPLAAQPAEEQERLRAYIRKMYGFFGYGLWAVVDKKTNRLIGRAGFDLCRRAVNGESGAELGYLVAAPFRGRGIGAEVCGAILRYGFETLEFEQVQALTAPENAASIALLGKLGFHRAQTRIAMGSHVVMHDGLRQFVLTAREWRER